MRSEFEFINDIKSRFTLDLVGDDCAVLPMNGERDLLITADMLVDNVDFRLDWSTPEQIGHKALAVSLSDIAAMGGTPRHALISIAVVENLWKGDFLDRFYEGWHRLARQFGVQLIGGDLSRTSGPLTIDSTVIGEAPAGRAIRRSGAKPGDGIYVTGTLGGSAGGLELLNKYGSEAAHLAPDLVSRQLEPIPQIDFANQQELFDLMSSMIDLSDGLSSDLMHVCRASSVGAEIWAEALPVNAEVGQFFTANVSRAMALNGGEDFELLFTADEAISANFALLGATLIGRITPNSGCIQLRDGEKLLDLVPLGYRHF